MPAAFCDMPTGQPRHHFGMSIRLLLRCFFALLLVLSAIGKAGAQPAWAGRMEAGLAALDDQGPRLGVYLRDLDTGASAGIHVDQRWYLASTVKVPIAIAVLRAVERGSLTLDSLVTLHADDYVDGSGRTNRQPPGARIPVRRLMEQMILYSDNTASDLLIGQVGIEAVNAVVSALVPDGFGRITTLAQVRRAVYGGLHPAAARLAGREWLQLDAQPNDTARLQLFSQLADVPPAALRLSSLDAAYDGYYASGLNSARLDAYADLLQALVQGRALGPVTTDYLLGLMGRIATGRHRVSAGLPPAVDFAHKTGTQRRRICDSGIVGVPRGDAPPQRVLLVSCVRDASSLQVAERTLRQVGELLCRSGLITKGVPDAPTCHASVGARRLPAASQRSGR